MVVHRLPDGQTGGDQREGGENERVEKRKEKEREREREECFKTKISFASFDWQGRDPASFYYTHTRGPNMGLLHPPIVGNIFLLHILSICPSKQFTENENFSLS